MNQRRPPTSSVRVAARRESMRPRPRRSPSESYRRVGCLRRDTRRDRARAGVVHLEVASGPAGREQADEEVTGPEGCARHTDEAPGGALREFVPGGPDRKHDEEAEGAVLDQRDGCGHGRTPGLLGQLDRSGAVLLAEQVQTDGGPVARYRLDVADHDLTTVRTVGTDRERAPGERGLRSHPAQERSPVHRVDHVREGHGLDAGVASGKLHPPHEALVAGRDGRRVELEQAADADEDLRVGDHPTLEHVHGLRGLTGHTRTGVALGRVPRRHDAGERRPEQHGEQQRC